MAELKPVDFETARPLGYWVVIRRDEAPPLKFGLVAPESSIHFRRRWTGQILGVGTDVPDKDIKIGLRVLIDPLKGGDKLDRMEQDERDLFVHYDNVALIVTDPEVDIVCQA